MTAAADIPQTGAIASRLNWLRAAVLGANDGIVSTAGLVVGVAGATGSTTALFIAGLAGIVSGALSMAAGEYVSVSSQRDSEKAELDYEAWELSQAADRGVGQLTELIQHHGIPPHLAREVAEELTARDALAAHARYELGINPEALTNPVSAALSSMLAFAAGALIPFAAVMLSPEDWRVPVTGVAVIVALALTGIWAARLGKAPILRATLRNVIGGTLAMAISYGIGAMVGTQL